MEEGTSQGTKSSSTKVTEKTVYLNFLVSLRPDLVMPVILIFGDFERTDEEVEVACFKALLQHSPRHFIHSIGMCRM